MVTAARYASYWRRVFQAWHALAPSTHHDYICGTAFDPVTYHQQIPLLRDAHREAQSAVAESLNALLGVIDAPAGDVVIVNASGTFFTGTVELPAPVPAGMNSIIIGSAQNPVQPTFEGGLVFQAQMPSLSYSTATLSSASVTDPPALSISPQTSGADSYTLQNEFLTVTVSADQNWGISSIADGSGSLLQSGATGNDLIFYADQGNLYQFANETNDYASGFVPAQLSIVTSGTGLGATVLEQGPVRVRLQTVVSIAVNGVEQPSQNYIREYCLVAGEPFLRMTTTGAAPSNFSVMAAFPLAYEPNSILSILHGTPYHWTSLQPYVFWTAPVFRATHRFVLPQANGTALAPIYHHAMPAWGYDPNGVLLGCLLRNTPNAGRGANGSDSHVHTLHYAMRSPAGLGVPASGQPLAEAMAYAAPAMAGIVPSDRTGPQVLPPTGSIASVSSPGFISAAKPGDVTPGTLILRIYQPSNSPQSLNVTLGRGQPVSVTAVTALEDPISDGAPIIEITQTGFTIEAVTALNTVQISFAD